MVIWWLHEFIPTLFDLWKTVKLFLQVAISRKKSSKLTKPPLAREFPFCKYKAKQMVWKRGKGKNAFISPVEFILTCLDLSKNIWTRLNLSAKSPSCKRSLEFRSDVGAVYSIVDACKYLNNLQYIHTKVRWRFQKILWPPQNIWTLTWQENELAQKIFFFFLFSF